MTHRVPVFYTPAMSAATQSYSPSSGKPALVVQDWQQHWDIAILEPRQATLDELKLAHNPDYVDGVLACTLPNGFRNHDPAVAATLPWTVGAMLSAAEWAVERYGTACAPVSGFHHAHWDHGGGFCTFNGLMVTALSMLQRDEVDHVFILDLDQHYGDGTDDILRKLPELEAACITNFTAGQHFGRPGDAGLFFGWLKQSLRLIRGHEAERKLVLVQLGADAHINDPLGGYLTTEDMAHRDREVLRWLNAWGIPTVWNLAGGYQRDQAGSIEPVLEIHRNSMAALFEGEDD